MLLRQKTCKLAELVKLVETVNELIASSDPIASNDRVV